MRSAVVDEGEVVRGQGVDDVFGGGLDEGWDDDEGGGGAEGVLRERDCCEEGEQGGLEDEAHGF